MNSGIDCNKICEQLDWKHPGIGYIKFCSHAHLIKNKIIAEVYAPLNSEWRVKVITKCFSELCIFEINQLNYINYCSTEQKAKQVCVETLIIKLLEFRKKISKLIYKMEAGPEAVLKSLSWKYPAGRGYNPTTLHAKFFDIKLEVFKRSDRSWHCSIVGHSHSFANSQQEAKLVIVNELFIRLLKEREETAKIFHELEQKYGI